MLSLLYYLMHLEQNLTLQTLHYNGLCSKPRHILHSMRLSSRELS